MAIKFRKDDKDLLILLEGRVSIAEAATMFGTLKDNPDSFVTLDMEKLEGMDSSIAQLIIATVMKYGEKNLRIIPPSEAVIEMLDQVGLLSRIEMLKDSAKLPSAVGEV